MAAVQLERIFQGIEAFADMRHGSGRFAGVDRDAHHLRASARQRMHLHNRALDIGGIGIGHRLHQDGRIATERQMRDIDLTGEPAIYQ